MANKICRCGCESESSWLVKSFEFDPKKPDGKGKYFKEQCCTSAKLYLAVSASDLNFPCECIYIGDPSLKRMALGAI